MQKERKWTQCLGCMEEYETYDNVCPFCGYVNGTPPEEMFHLEPGSVLNRRYLIGRVLGFGGFGITYIAWDQTLRRKVAIKEYMPRDCALRMTGKEQVTILSGEKSRQFRDGLESFKEEAGKLLRLQDLEGTVKVFDLFEENRTAYLVMEYLDGNNLAQLLKEKDKLSVGEALKMIAPVMEALKEIHKEGLVHRDISPDNIFVTKDGKVKLLDFGSARYASLVKNRSVSVIVKKGYAPPEQYQANGPQGEWLDVYSLAATIYRMITGVVPEDALDRVAEDDLKKPSELGVEIDKNQENALMNALNTEFSSRTRNIETLEAQLFDSGEVPEIDNVTGLPVKTGRKKTGTVKKIFLAAALLVCIGTGVFFIVQQKKTVDNNDNTHTETKVALNYVNLPREEAEELAEEAGIKLEVSDTENNEFAAEGIILEQDPEAGEELKTDTINVILSAGKKTVKVKDYVGVSEEKAEEMAEEGGTTLTIGKAEESNFIKDYVTGQSREAGDDAPKGSELKLTISAGRTGIDAAKKREMPSLVGMTLAKALKAAEEGNFYIGIKNYEYSLKVKKGSVIRQSVKKGEEISGGREVLLVISDGPEQMKVPEVVGKSLEEAKEALEKQKLKYTCSEEKSSEHDKGVVIDQSIESGKTVDEGTKIDLVVSKGE